MIPTSNALSLSPTLTKLFGSMDLCECMHCRSVYGPAAYLVDLLQFLDPKWWEILEALAGKSIPPPLDVLLNRRIDLQYIKLNCENSDTKLPYVDLVNEILESYVASSGTMFEGLVIPRDTSDATAEELSVNPQYTIEPAYDRLREAVHSFVLPFNRPVEVARAYLEHLGSSRYEVMALFQRIDDPNNPDSKTPSDLALALEYLRISPEEYDIMLANTVGSKVLVGASEKLPQEFFGYADDTIDFEDSTGQMINNEAWRKNVSRVPEFLRRTGVSYLELVELIKTRFINPNQDMIPLPADLIVLFSPASVCDLSVTVIRHLQDPVELHDAEWLKMHRFLRIWRKLDWSMQEIDKAIGLFGAADIDGLLQNLAYLQRLRTELNLPVIQLLTLWADIDTDGRDSLYVKLFQNKAVINPADVAFSLRYAAPLSSAPGITFGPLSDKISYDAAAKQLQFVGSMTADERTTLLNLPTTPNPDYQLAIENLFQMRQFEGIELAGDAEISNHTPAILAALRINEDDLVVLREAAKLSDKSAPLTLANLSLLYRHALMAKAMRLKIQDLVVLFALIGIDPSLALTPQQTINFVERARNALNSDFSVAQLNYLYRHILGPGKSIAPLEESVIILLKKLQEGLRKIIDETALVPDSAGEIIRGKLGIVLDGVLVDAGMDLIEGKSTMIIAEKEAFIDQNFASFLPNLAEAKTVLLGSPDLSAEERAGYLFPRLMTYLRAFLSRSLVKQMLSDALELDSAMTQLLLETLLESQSGTGKAISDFLALVGDGLSAEYFNNKDLSGQPTLLPHVDPAINFYWGDSSPNEQLLPPAAFSVRWQGLVMPQHDETYTFYLRANDGVRLWLDDMNQPLIDAWQDQDQSIEHVSPEPKKLSAGQVYHIKLEYYTNGPDASVELSWSSLSTPKSIIPQSELYSGTSFVPLEGLLRSYYRLVKIALLANTFDMTAEQAAFFSTNSADFGGFDLSALPLDRLDPSVDTKAVDLFRQWEHIRDYFVLRDSLPQGEVDLLDVLGSASGEGARTQLAAMTGWDAAEIDFLASPPGLNFSDQDFKNPTGLLRLLSAFKLDRRLGVGVTLLQHWAVNQPDKNQAKEIVHTVKAKYKQDEWLTVAKPLNDVLREKQKAALIAYILEDDNIVKQKITNSNQLFEYFLIDVNMSACMITSRIKQAISSVQLFIQRCLMNLEEEVAPAAIDEEQWKWMKNYGIWEANRKVFLYPENWIEPELRDDKSQFFKELETQLLQNEVTKETVEQAYLTYLEKLDDVARLEVCGVYRHQEGETDIVHVFGRTTNPPHIYYYRSYEVAAGVWTPWEKVDHVEGEHLIPVVYNRRLHLFWATFEEQPDPKQDLSLLPIRSPEEMQYEVDYDHHLMDHEKWVLEFNADKKAQDASDAEQQQPQVSYNDCHIAVPGEVPGPGEWIEPRFPPPLYDICHKAFLPKPKPYESELRKEPTFEEKDFTKFAKAAKMRWAIKLSWIERWSTGWSAKRLSKDYLYSSGGEIGDYRFQSAVSSEGELSVVCYQLFKELGETLDAVSLVGWFSMKGCRQELQVLESENITLRSMITPYGSRFLFMRFDQISGNTLTFIASAPSYKEYAVLENTPTNFRLLHPPYDIEPHGNDFASAIYPFFYQDDYRTYFAMPTLDEARAFHDPVPSDSPYDDIVWEEVDPLGYKETGDPARFETVSDLIGAKGIEVEAISAKGGSKYGFQ